MWPFNRKNKPKKVRRYEGAEKRRRFNDWHASGVGPNAEIRPDIKTLRARSRDLVRNNAYASRGIESLVSNAVGNGIVPRVTTQNSDFNEMIHRRFNLWAQTADASGKQTYYGIQALATRGALESGDVFIVRVTPSLIEGQVPLKLRVLEADHLDQEKHDVRLDNGNTIVQGIEFGANGSPRAYWLFPVHPGETSHLSAARVNSVRVPAEDVIHVYEQTRPGQVRGVPRLAPVIKALRDLGDYVDAELMKQKLAACFGLVVTCGSTASDRLTDAPLQDAAGNAIENLYPGLVGYVAEEGSIEALQPPSTVHYEQFMRVKLHEIAAGMGNTYSNLSGDLSLNNFSSSRVGLNEFQRGIKALQHHTIIPSICDRVWRWWVDAAFLAGQIQVPVIRAEWSTPIFESVNPLQDGKARKQRLRDGVATLAEEIAALGKDPRQIFAERAREKELLSDLGLSFDSQPWDMTDFGQVQVIREGEEQLGELEDDPSVVRSLTLTSSTGS